MPLCQYLAKRCHPMTPTSRIPLPNRRENLTAEVTWRNADHDHEFTVTVGFDPSGEPKEVFCNHAKGALAATLADVCVIISVALQHGIASAELEKSLGRIPAWPAPQTAPASPVGTILGVVADVAARVDGGGGWGGG